MALAGALRFATGHAAHAVCGGTLFALGAVGVGLQGWHAVKRLRKGEWQEESCQSAVSRSRRTDIWPDTRSDTR